MTDPDLEVTRIRRFGTIVARKRSDGSISAWLARYSSPVDGRRVQRSFESVRDAMSHGLPANMSWSKCTVVV